MDTSWGEFIRMLSYKAEGAGGIVIKILPHDTSKKCAMCGTKINMELSDWIFKCPVCVWMVNRYNASLNILKKLNRSDVPVKRDPLLHYISSKDIIPGQDL